MGFMGNTRAIGPCILLLLLNVAITANAGSISLGDAILALPACSLDCLNTAIPTSGCSPVDVSCICSNEPLNTNLTACITAACTVREQLTAKNITSHLCGVRVDTDDEIVPVFAAFLSFTLFAVTLRVAARVLTKAYFWWDDFCNLFALAGCIIFAALNIKSVDFGYGKDTWFVPFDHITEVLKIFFVDMLLYTLTRFFVRASIILFYLRVFPSNPDHKMRRILVWTMVANFIYNLAFFIAVIFQCDPISHFWTQWEGLDDGHCGNVNVLAWVAAATGIVFDVWLLALPFPQLIALNLHWKKKVMGAVMFGVGACVMIISLIRLKSLNEFTRAVNPTKDIVQVCLWSGIEIDVGVICPCLPSLRLLLRRILPRVMGTTNGRYELDPRSNVQASRKSYAHIVKTTSIGVEFSTDDDRSRHGGGESVTSVNVIGDSDEERLHVKH
ncbi:CFEM domain-containing protein [Apodospora peruviana]|uniref:CFEM domain-containing protein n=1 Tax=Apodospora peruviana TaxID=516989 RepID=A0AAE0M122_9PEZI|nr:CFEM domain-containing protein [Apodospora peruviana]